MASIAASGKGLIGHPTFSRSIESHGSGHSADTNYNGWRGESNMNNEDIGTQTEYSPSNSHMGTGGRSLLGESKRRREDAILDISLESMKYNGGKSMRKENQLSINGNNRMKFLLRGKLTFVLL